MTNLLSRVFLAVVAVPALYSLVVFLPQLGHGALVLVVILFAAGCGVELSRLFRQDGVEAKAWISGVLAALPSLSLWTILRFRSSEEHLQSFLVVYCLIFLIAQIPFVFPSKGRGFEGVLGASAARAFPMVYPGLFAPAIILIADYPTSSTQAILWFALLVFGNDSAAWAVGMLFGRHRGIVLVSPNKSLEGFIGAYAGSLGASFLGLLLFPEAISGSAWKLTVLGLGVGTAVITGDLFESALKRSVGIKDSGTAIPGRGGFLDTFDSIIFAAPVFYAAIRILEII